MATRTISTTSGALLAAGALLLTACGGDDSLDDVGSAVGDQIDQVGDQAGDEAEDFADAMNEVTGADQGSGSLTFDGRDFEITSVLCQFGDDGAYEVGSVSDDGWRVQLSKRDAESDPSIQVLSPETGQWFSDDDQVSLDGSTFTSDTGTYFSNNVEGRVEGSFTLTCP